MYLTAPDAAGIMMSMVQSNYIGFCSGVVVPETGIPLQNRSANFLLIKDIRTLLDIESITYTQSFGALLAKTVHR